MFMPILPNQIMDPLQYILSKPVVKAESEAHILAAAIPQQQFNNQKCVSNNTPIYETASEKEDLEEKPFAKILSIEKQTHGRVVEVEITPEALYQMLQLRSPPSTAITCKPFNNNHIHNTKYQRCNNKKVTFYNSWTTRFLLFTGLSMLPLGFFVTEEQTFQVGMELVYLFTSETW
ncbi:hypothetical protein COEREDRAFT_83825 [Coemansia reversa NRRL 1564]|uniref:Uncharacterized protein n=1 Tax=Coemansia reversa (strain ATCC 12441 / NRRL 1564) TaxID=763665 RepID=A0A2G5B1P9_COERN|nr:hypothetical protein COEREDRAFT_83825 [Coemansia reversa NRRL 1564]|eukprot:PIA12911.1 hypothetical protein COEREDRAFT_83825 [Coemansia reversa NRRL 1564]